MEDHALAKAFPAIARSIVRIVVARDGRDQSSGTGWIFGRTRKTQRAGISTARHVLPTDEQGGLTPGLHIRIERYDEHMKVCRTAIFSTDAHDDTFGSYITVDKAEGADVALVIAPRDSEDGSLFFEEDTMIAPVMDQTGPAPATRIAWAGFPGLLSEVLGKPQLCYYEGAVSSWARYRNRQLIVVDGHAMPGVSGGPVWFFHDELRQVRVAGIISTYASHSTPVHFHPHLVNDEANQRRDRMPGFVFVQPICGLIAHALKLGK